MSAKRIAELSVAWLFHALVVLAAVAVAETVPGIPPTQRPDVAAAQPGVISSPKIYQIIPHPDCECEASLPCRCDAALPDPWDPVDEAAPPLYEWDSPEERESYVNWYQALSPQQREQARFDANPRLKEELDRILAEQEEKEAPIPEETEPAELTVPEVSEPVEPEFTWDDYAEWFENLDPDDQERERARLTAEHEAALDQAMAQREAAEAPASAEDVREEEPDPLDDPWRDWVKWWAAVSPEERERAAQEQGLDAEQQEMLNQRVAEQAAHPEAAEAPAPEADPVDEAAPPLYEWDSPEERESYVKWYQSLSPQERERARFADPHLKEELDRILAEQEEKEAPLPEETEPAELTEPEVLEPVEPEPPAAETVPGISPMPGPDADAAQPDGEPGADVAPPPADGDPTPGAAHEPAASTAPDGPPAASPAAPPGKVQWTIRAEPGESLNVNDWRMVEPYILKDKGVPWVYWQVAGLTDGGPTIEGRPLEPDEQPEPRWVSVSQTEPDRVIWSHAPEGYSDEYTQKLIEWYRAGGSGTHHYDKDGNEVAAPAPPTIPAIRDIRIRGSFLDTIDRAEDSLGLDPLSTPPGVRP